MRGSMSRTTKRTYAPKFKMAVALEAVKGEKGLSQVARSLAAYRAHGTPADWHLSGVGCCLS